MIRTRLRVAFWGVLLVLDLAILSAATLTALREPPAAKEVHVDEYVAGAAIMLVLMVFIPHRWLRARHHVSSRQAWSMLGFRRPGLHDAVRGLAAGGGLLLLLLMVALVVLALGFPSADGARLRRGDHGILAFLLFPLLIGAAEEVFFRGFLQPKFGRVAQATLFALLHAPFPSLLHAAFPLAAGLALGQLRHRGLNLWALILAHALYDALQLALSHWR